MEKNGQEIWAGAKVLAPKTISHPAEASQREKKPILKQDVSEK